MSTPLDRWSRSAGIVLPTEQHRLDNFYDLFEDMLRRHAADPDHPTALEALMVRDMVGSLWRYLREGDDTEDLLAEVYSCSTTAGARRALFIVFDEKCRARKACVEAVHKTIEVLADCRGAEPAADTDTNVVEMPTPLREVV